MSFDFGGDVTSRIHVRMQRPWSGTQMYADVRRFFRASSAFFCVNLRPNQTLVKVSPDLKDSSRPVAAAPPAAPAWMAEDSDEEKFVQHR
jgi:hypothetical protein